MTFGSAWQEPEDRCPFTGKVSYASPQRAWRALRRKRKVQVQKSLRTLRVYRCEECPDWHLGRSSRDN